MSRLLIVDAFALYYAALVGLCVRVVWQWIYKQILDNMDMTTVKLIPPHPAGSA